MFIESGYLYATIVIAIIFIILLGIEIIAKGKKMDKLAKRSAIQELAIGGLEDACYEKIRVELYPGDYDYITTNTPKTDALTTKLDLLLKELGYEYKPETEKKEPAQLVKTKTNEGRK